MKTSVRTISLSAGIALLFLLAFFLVLAPVSAQGPVPFTEDFASFTGAGFAPSPSAGQLDSDTWIVKGLSAGDLNFGDTGASGDYARGQSSGGVGTGGVYAFDAGGGNPILGVQPGGSDFTPGEFILRIQNNTGSTLTQLDVSYKIWTYNDQPRANSLNFSYSSDDSTYTGVPSLDFTTPGAADSSPAWVSTTKTTSITGVSIANGDYYYLRWRGDDVSGSGSRDEYGIDDVRVTPVYQFAISKSAPDKVFPGEVFTYTLYITNGTGISTTGTIVTDTVPTYATYVPGSASDGGALVSGDTVSWTVTGNFTVGTTISRTFKVTATSSVGVDIVNDDYVVVAANWTTPTAGAKVTTSIPSLDLEVGKTGPACAIAGENIVYTITVENVGVVSAANGVVSDSLPISTTYVSDNSGWTCPACTPGATGVITWNAGTLVSATLYTFNLTVTVDADVASGEVLTNEVTVDSDLPGDDPLNNTAKAGTTAYPLSTIATARSGSDGEDYAVEGKVTYTPGTYNSRGWGLQDASGGIAVYYNPPPSVALGDQVRLIAPRDSYNNEEQLGSPLCPLVNLGSGPEVEPKPYTTGDVAAGNSEGWLVVVTGTISGLDCSSYNYSFDLDDGSGAASIYVDGTTGVDVCGMGAVNGDRLRVVGFSTQYNTTYQIKPRRDEDVFLFQTSPTIGKTAPALVSPGVRFTYTLTVTNDLEQALTNVVVTDVVPVSSTLASVLDGGVENSGVISWTTPTLAIGGSFVVRFAVTATNSTPAIIVNDDYAVQASNYTTPTLGASYATVVGNRLSIHHIQWKGHSSPFAGQEVEDIRGIVTALDGYGFYMQEPNPDAEDATSEGIYVRIGSAPAVNVGDDVLVDGDVIEYYPGGYGAGNVSTTRLEDVTVVVSATGQTVPAPIVVGTGGRVPPNMDICNDCTGDVETSPFTPDTDGFDFWESLEGMLLQVNDALVVGPTNKYDELPIVGDKGANGGLLTPRGGIVIRPDDFNPERIILDDALAETVDADVGMTFTLPISGVLSYSFGNYKLLPTVALPSPNGGWTGDSTTDPGANELSVASFNVYNLDPGDTADGRFVGLALQIIQDLKAPDIIGLQEIQDNNGATDDGTVDATNTYTMLIEAIGNNGGPLYEYRQIDPQNNQDGGQPGANIRVGFLFRTDRGLSFVDRPGGDATTAVGVTMGPTGPELTLSPGRIDPTNAAFDDSRKPLAGEFIYNGHKVIVAVNHFASKYGDDPLFGRVQPPVEYSKLQRNDQAQAVNDFVDSVLALDPNAKVIVIGDLNDFYFSEPVSVTLTGGVLKNLHWSLPAAERYTYVYDGNSQALDHILVSQELYDNAFVQFDAVHVNAERAYDVRKPSDHDPVVATFLLEPPDLSGSTKTVEPAGDVNAGDRLTYTVTLSNSGGANVVVTVTDTLPTELTLVSGFDGGGLTWSGVVTAGEKVVLTLVAQARVDLTANATVSNVVTIDDSVNAAFDIHSPDTTILAPGLTVTKDVTPTADLPLGGIVTYTITLNNGGDGLAEGVVMTDDLPAEVSFGGWVQQSGATLAGGEVSWTGDMASGAQVVIVFTATVGSAFDLNGQTVVNTANVTSDNAGSGSDDATFTIKTLWRTHLPMIFKGYP